MGNCCVKICPLCKNKYCCCNKKCEKCFIDKNYLNDAFKIDDYSYEKMNGSWDNDSNISV